MDKLNKSHVLILSLLAALLLITPILSSNLRPTYLYFITNVLIIALGAEAGLLSFFSNSPDGKRGPNNNNAGMKNPTLLRLPQPTLALDDNQSPRMIMDMGAIPASSYDTITNKKTKNSGDRVEVLEKCLSEKVGVINVGGNEGKKFKRCPSMPSLFFIGGAPEAETGNADREFDFDGDQEDELLDEGIISGQELDILNFFQGLKRGVPFLSCQNSRNQSRWCHIMPFYLILRHEAVSKVSICAPEVHLHSILHDAAALHPYLLTFSRFTVILFLSPIQIPRQCTTALNKAPECHHTLWQLASQKRVLMRNCIVMLHHPGPASIAHNEYDQDPNSRRD